MYSCTGHIRGISQHYHTIKETILISYPSSQGVITTGEHFNSIKPVANNDINYGVFIRVSLIISECMLAIVHIFKKS
jgi:hypothetical protein